MSSSSSSPSPLARFPAAVGEAYANFLSHRHAQDLQIVVEAVLREFMPKGKALPAGQPIPPDCRLVEDLGFDSLAVAEIVFFFEDLFKISIPTQEVLALRTVKDLHGFVERKLAGQAQVPAA